MTMTVEELKQKLQAFGEVLKHGAHAPQSGEVCALEFDAHVRGRGWSDAPLTLPDLQQLNDACWSSDDARTDALLPVMAALWDWSTWSEDRRLAWVRRVAVETVRQIVADLSSLPEDVQQRCREATTCEAAVRAARAAAVQAAAESTDAYAAAESAARAAAYADLHAESAARAAAVVQAAAAARAAAYATRADAADAVLRRACQIWIEAAKAAKEGETK